HGAAHNEGADVGSTCFFDVLLNEDVHVGSAEGFDNRFGGCRGLSKNYATALRTLEQLDHTRCAADFLHHVLGPTWTVRKGCHRHPDPLAREGLQRAQLAGGAADGYALV